MKLDVPRSGQKANSQSLLEFGLEQANPPCRDSSSRSAGSTKIRGYVTLLTLLIVGPIGFAAAQTSLHEYQVKSGFLLNFARFVEWPAAVLPENSSPFTICIIGPNPFGENAKHLEEKSIRNHSIRLKEIPRVSQPTELADCRVAYVAASQFNETLRASEAKYSVLTVGEEDSPAIIRFLIREGEVKFAIDAPAAERAKLRISSQLLKLSTH